MLVDLNGAMVPHDICRMVSSVIIGIDGDYNPTAPHAFGVIVCFLLRDAQSPDCCPSARAYSHATGLVASTLGDGFSIMLCHNADVITPEAVVKQLLDHLTRLMHAIE
jgi:hypothetical protein